MEISPRKTCKRTPDPVDEWLQEEGYFRKHAPKDPTCLFRAFSEQVYLTQHYHIRVREECVEFMRKNRQLFDENLPIPYENYLKQMACFTEWGGALEIEAMSLLYRRDVVVFNAQKLTRRVVTENGFDKMIYLCHMAPKQYESVYAKDYVSDAAFCQSLVYQTLYKDVFKMPGVDTTVHKMLHDRTSNFRHDKFFLKGNLQYREQMAAELYDKLENEPDEAEEIRSLARGITPFPYRVAKALDPNIYRNTDFDIWHEIRREVRSAGWTRYNSTELQVGGRCLVHMDTPENELDKANNNSTHTDGDKDDNGNEEKTSSDRTAGQHVVVYNGHIQEMSKNEGPVVVFIEELGEKRSVPHSSLKPVSLRKSKQSNWGLATPRKNAVFESTQKWKRSWSANSRKTKDTTSNINNANSNNVDPNNNGDNGVTGNNKGEYEDVDHRWDNESGHDEDDQCALSPEAYTMGKFTSYQGYAVDASIDVLPVTVVLNEAPRLSREKVASEGNEAVETSVAQSANNCKDADAAEKKTSPKSTTACAGESNPPPLCSVNSQNGISCSAQPGTPHYFPSNVNLLYAPPEGAPCSPFFVGTSGDSQVAANQIDRALSSINFAATKSIEENGSDLPFSDTNTLRFFYNLGLEYFRASHGWSCSSPGQSFSFGSYYMPQPNQPPLSSNAANPFGSTPSNEEAARVTENTRQNYSVPWRRRDNAENGGRANGDGQQSFLKTPAPRTNFPYDATNLRNENPRSTPETNKSSLYISSNERSKEQRGSSPSKESPRNNKSGLAPRFKKNIGDNRQRNFRQNQYQPPPPPHAIQYQPNAQYFDSPPPLYEGNDCGSDLQASLTQHSQSAMPSSGNSSVYQTPYPHQAVYATVPYYPGETENFPNPFFPPGPGFFPIPYVPQQTDVNESGNVNHYPAHIFPSMENYAPPCPAVFPPYVISQQNVYPGTPTQNAPENWYAQAGQAHYYQFGPLAASPNAGGMPQGLN